MITKPMLAGTIKALSEVRYPVIVSPKLDGIRCLKLEGKVLSRTFKPIPNDYIRTTLEKLLPDGVDGEIIVGDVFQQTTSAVMSKEGEPAFAFWMFDAVGRHLNEPYKSRLLLLKNIIDKIGDPRIVEVPTYAAGAEEALLGFEKLFLEQGYEGLMTRDPDGPYKCGRSTVKEGWLLKLKRFEDHEAEILGFVEQLQNTNAAEKNELGYTKRSSAKAGKVGKGTLGKFKVRDLESGVVFFVGTGLTDEQRQEIWNHKARYQGKLVKYKCQPYGEKDKPRLPVFLGFRDERDR